MSDILGTAKLYTANNTFRSDTSGNTRGNARQDEGTRIGFDCSGLVYHVLRESGYNVPYAPSGVMQSDGNFTGSWATALNEKSAVSPGTLVYFNGHVGIVNSYNPEIKTGTFLSMTGKNNEGSLKPEEPFTTDNKNTDPNITWGKTTAFKGFAAVNQNLYDPQLDQHANGANANTPVFNIPEAKNAGFVTLPQNGGFPMLKEAKDLSALERITAANQGVTLLTGADAAKGSTPFAVTLANLESRGKPDDGYTAQQFDHDAKGNVLPGIGAIGRYGFRASSLKAIGWMDGNGEWTDAAKSLGVDSVDAFKDNPQAQEDARVAYIQVLKGELRNNGAWDRIGTTADGEVVSEAGGLIAAAWKEGARPVAQFFNGNASANAETNIKFRLGEFSDVPLATGQESAGHGSGAAHSVSSNGTETPITPYNAMGDFPNAGEPVSSPGASTSKSPTTTAPPADPHAPYVARSIPTPNGDGTTTSTGVAIGNSSDGLIAKGDTVSAVKDVEGKTLSEVIVHKTASGTAVTERIFDPNGGPPTETSTETDKSGNIDYQMTTRGGQVLGDSYISNGVTYASPAPGTGYDAWLDPNGHTQTERAAQGVTDSDTHINRHATLPTPELTASSGVPDPHTVLTDYKQIDHDGNTYAVGPNGRLSSSAESTQCPWTGLEQAKAHEIISSP